MRSFAIVAAALAATVAATPMKRDEVIVTDSVVDMDYVTDVVTVTAGESAAATTVVAAATSTTTAAAVTYSPHGHHHWQPSSSASSAVVAAPSSTSVAAAPSVASTSSEAAAPPSSSAVASTQASTSASSSSVASSASTAVAAAAATATTYQEATVNHHNYHRANHSASALTWDSNLASIAASIAATCVYEHNTTAGGGGYGQNIAAGVPSANISAVITELFYNGEVNNFAGLYGQNSPDMSNFENWGHFSQVVWKTTTTVGCATHDCSSSGLANTGGAVSPYFTVCNYGPPGNYIGEFASGVGASLNQASVQWNDGIPSAGVSGN